MSMESYLEKLFQNLHRIPKYRVNPYETYQKFYNSKGIRITSPKDVLLIDDKEIEDFVRSELLKRYITKTSGIGFLTGLPGGAIGIASSVADIEEYIRYIYQFIQELMYIYGIFPFQDMEGISENEELFWKLLNEEVLKAMLIAFGGASIGSLSKKVVTTVGQKEAQKLLKRRATDKLIKILSKEVAKLIGKNISKKTVSTGIMRAIPILGGLVSAGINFWTFSKAGDRLIEWAKKERAKLKERYAIKI